MNLSEAICDELFDKKDPFEKFVHLYGEDEYPRNLCLALVALHAGDAAIKKVLEVDAIYFLGDRVVAEILNAASLSENDDYSDHLMQLTMMQLIYRFTAATKFGIADTSVKQLRINAWGRKFVDGRLLPRYLAEYEACLAAVVDVITVNKAAYTDQISLLRSAISPSSATEIAKMNDLFSIKMVS